MVKATSDSVAATPSPTKTKPSPRLTRSMRKKPIKSPAASAPTPVKKSTAKKVAAKDKKPAPQQDGSSPQIKAKQAANPPITPAAKPVLTQIQQNGSSPVVKPPTTPQTKPQTRKVPTTPVSAKKNEVTPEAQNSQAAVTPQPKPKPGTPQSKAKSPKAAATPLTVPKTENATEQNSKAATTPQAKPNPGTPQNKAKTPNAVTPASSKKAANAAAQNSKNLANSETKPQTATPHPKGKTPQTPVSAKKPVENGNVQNSPVVASPQVKAKLATPQPKPKNPQTPVSAKKIEATPAQQAAAVATPPNTPKAEQRKRKTPQKPASAKKADIVSQTQTDSPQVKAPATPVSKPEAAQTATPAPTTANVDTPKSSAKKRKRKNKKSAEEKTGAPETETPSPAKKPHVETPAAPATPKVVESKPEDLKQNGTPQSAGKAKKNKKKNKKNKQKAAVLTEVKELQVSKVADEAKGKNEAKDAKVDGEAAEEKHGKKNEKITLEPEKVTKGIEALKTVLEKEAEKKNVLFGDDPLPIFMQVASIKISKNGQKTIRMDLPHPINKARDDSEVILFVKDLEKGIRKDHEATLLHYQELLKKFHVNRITEVMPFRQLRAEYMQYEAKGKLAKRFDTFLVDDRIAPSVATSFGQQFFKTGKVFIPVDMTSRKLKEEIDDAIDKTYLHLSSHGNCSQVQIGLSSQPTEEIAANVFAVAAALAQKFPGGMLNVRSLVIRTPDSVAVPLYYSFLSRDCIRMKKKAETKKQYVGELSTLNPGQKVRVTEEGAVEVFSDPNYVRGEVDKDLFGLSDQEDAAEEPMDEGSEASSEEQNEHDSDEEEEKPAPKKQKKTNKKTEAAAPKANEASKDDEDSSEDEEADEAERAYLKRIHGDEEVDQNEENDMESEEAEDNEEEDGESEEEEVPVKKVVKKNAKASKPVKGKGKK